MFLKLYTPAHGGTNRYFPPGQHTNMKDVKMNRKMFATVAAFVMGTILISTPCMAAGNSVLGNLPDICKKYITQIKDLRTQYRNAKDPAQKEAFKKQGDDKFAEFKQAAENEGLVGKNIPFEVSGNLPFKVSGVKITQAGAKSVKFEIQTKITKDITDDKGQIKQRISIYFAAFDTDKKAIPDTTNFATNHGWIELKAGTDYTAQGHWNAKRVQTMQDFAFIGIMPKEEYDKIN